VWHFILKTHFDFITQRFAGQGTSFQVCIPSKDANLSSAAFNQQALLLHFRSGFQFFGVLTSCLAAAAFAQFPRRSEGFFTLVDDLITTSVVESG
jgi:hypothetical protein